MHKISGARSDLAGNSGLWPRWRKGLTGLAVAYAAAFSGPVEAESAIEPRFDEISPCPFGSAAEADQSRLRCGYLVVPENRAEEASAAIRIPVAIIQTLSENPQSDPLVFLHGGPGGAPLTSAGTFSLFGNYPLGVNRDIIVYNQRASLMVDPALDCGRTSEMRRLAPYADDLTLEERDARIVAFVRGCLTQLDEQGRDLRGYSAVENAHDLLDLRRLLGIDQWNLMAVSYGTYMSIEAARVDPNGIRAMILDSIVSTESDLFLSEANRNFTLGMHRLIAACTEDESCAEAFPDFSGQLDTLLTSLDTNPATITVPGGELGATVDIIVNWHDFLNLVHWMMYNERLLRLVPLLVSETNHGNMQMLTYLMDNVQPAPKNMQNEADGAFFTIVCRDQFTTRNPITAPESPVGYRGFSIVSFMPEICEMVMPLVNGNQPTEPPESFTSDIPTVLLTGAFDPMTNYIYAQQLEQQLSHVSRITIPNYGHSTLSGYTACQTQLAAHFLDTLDDVSDYPCLAELEGPQFILTLQEAIAGMGGG